MHEENPYQPPAASDEPDRADVQPPAAVSWDRARLAAYSFRVSTLRALGLVKLLTAAVFALQGGAIPDRLALPLAGQPLSTWLGPWSLSSLAVLATGWNLYLAWGLWHCRPLARWGQIGTSLVVIVIALSALGQGLLGITVRGTSTAPLTAVFPLLIHAALVRLLSSPPTAAVCSRAFRAAGGVEQPHDIATLAVKALLGAVFWLLGGVALVDALSL